LIATVICFHRLFFDMEVEAMVETTLYDDEGLVTDRASHRRGWRSGVLAGAAGMAALAGAAIMTKSALASSSSLSLQGKEERVDMTPSFWACSGPQDDCSNSGCCKVSGHKCFTKVQGARCNETCTAGKQGFTCDIVGHQSVPVQSVLGTNLYCFAVYTKDTGSPKPSTELALLTKQKQYGASLFACEWSDVYSDVSVDIGGYTTIKVEDYNGEFHQIKRKETKSWVNWGLFYQVWMKVKAQDAVYTADYTVKVDPDAVFIPQRLRAYLGNAIKGDSPHGLYLENCQNVQYGFFGHLEVISREGARVLTSNLEECHAQFAPCANEGCDWKWGAWGEDVFTQRCMDHHYVDKVEAFDMTTDGACAADRPEGEKKNKKWHAEDCSQLKTVTAHPYKKPEEYMKCLSEMTGQQFVA